MQAPDPSVLASILAVAVSAARSAGALINAHRGRVSVEKTKSGFQDLVTAIDAACEALISAAVRASFPAHAFLGEEGVAPGRSASIAATRAALELGAEFLWVIDPIDGTTNLVCGLPMSVVSIGVAHRGTVVVAVIYEPSRDELYTAIRGGGAFLNGTPLTRGQGVEGGLPMRDGVWGFGTHNSPAVGMRMIRAAGAFVCITRGLRALGSAALALAYVASGRLAGYFEQVRGWRSKGRGTHTRPHTPSCTLSMAPFTSPPLPFYPPRCQDLNSWDLAAGSLLVEEVGGRVTDMRGGSFSLLTRDVCASGGAGAAITHNAALQALADADANDSEVTYAEAGAEAR